MKRRPLLISLLGTTSVLASPRPASASPVRAAARDVPASGAELDLSLVFADPASARSIGRRYLAQYPERSSRSRLLAELDLPAARPAAPGRAGLIEWIEQAQQRDFAEGRTVVVNNWVLSRTEAALCALSALS